MRAGLCPSQLKVRCTVNGNQHEACNAAVLCGMRIWAPLGIKGNGTAGAEVLPTAFVGCPGPVLADRRTAGRGRRCSALLSTPFFHHNPKSQPSNNTTPLSSPRQALPEPCVLKDQCALSSRIPRLDLRAALWAAGFGEIPRNGSRRPSGSL